MAEPCEEGKLQAFKALPPDCECPSGDPPPLQLSLFHRQNPSARESYLRAHTLYLQITSREGIRPLPPSLTDRLGSTGSECVTCGAFLKLAGLLESGRCGCWPGSLSISLAAI